MSRPIFIGRFLKPEVRLHDHWKRESDSSGKVPEKRLRVILKLSNVNLKPCEALCRIDVDGSWDDLQIILTKAG